MLGLLGVNAVLIVGMWVRHGGLSTLNGASGDLTAAGELTALLGTYAALVQLLLMSRSPFVERLAGLDRLAHWHRWLGFSCVVLICGHVVLTTAGYALGDGSSFASETWTLLTTYPWVLMAAGGTVCLLMVAVTSVRAARRRLRYETWHFVHLYAYLAIALSLGHELAVGNDLSADPVARAYWIALYVAVAGCVLAFRVGHPVRLALRHRLRVAEVVPEAAGVVSVYVVGRDLERLRARAGQYFRWRFLAGDGWWKAHPFSLSAAPNPRFLRLTVKAVGDGSGDVQRLVPGTRVVVEGPYGIFTAQRRRRSGVLLIAGGVGITPLRALLEELGGHAAVTLVYRARSWDDVLFRAEIDQLATARRITVHYLVGRRGSDGPGRDPLSARALRTLVPDVAQRDVFVCGPPGMVTGVRETLRELRVPDAQIHHERFGLL
ncbi:MAG TPA: ferredoxin reductase family protein [Candidatus Dormibacteraeota bacterium]|nr:ferredoxin reductase family protein [Candidatus Dormibacteraeota bacterium]